MKLSALLFPLVLASSSAFSSVITFDNSTIFNAQFPTSSRYAVGGASQVSLLTGPSRVNLHAQQSSGDSGPASMTIFSTSSADYDFISSSKTIEFSNVGFAYASNGATYSGILGVFSNTGAGTAATDDGVYFLIDRGGSRLRFMERYNGTAYLRSEWTGLGSNPNAYSFSSMSMTLDASGWSVSATSLTGATYANSGVFTNGSSALTWNSSNWGTNFYLGLESQQTLGSLDTARYLDLSVQSITAVPEPGSVALLALGGSVAALAWLRRRRA
jgi:hypothetical protein